MDQKFREKELRREIVDLKDWDSRKYNYFVDNFYVLRSALRYFAVKKGVSFTSSKVAENFPLPVTVAGSCLTVLNKLDVVDVRTVSSSPDRYLPEKVDLDKLAEVEKVLKENHEIEDFK